ncbi:MAG: hypothetical protein RMK18_02930 [Armatimonadota bacterium]|nr:hypothetical protein [Armatimonadota bacterium]MCX7776969.1 hypothetical protein [Armatimonadota bacterium]MDW8024803.1 hypothetical protein [Armatimonadota bacterium]
MAAMPLCERIGIVLEPTSGSWDAKGTAAPIVWHEDGCYFMLYQGWEKGSGWRGDGSPRMFGLAMSEDGIHWEKHNGNPVLTPTEGSFDELGFEAGCLLKLGDEYWLYYSGFAADGKLRIGLAFSNDLVNWRKFDSNPIVDPGTHESWDCDGVAFPSVIRMRHEWLMLYSGYGPHSMQIGGAISGDGKNWIKHGDNPLFLQRGWHEEPECPFWDAGIEVHHAFIHGDHITMFYEGIGRQGRYGIGIAYSPDGIAWARSSRNPIMGLTDATVKQDMSVVHPWVLQGMGLLYYSEVLGASAGAVHRICAAKLNMAAIEPEHEHALVYSLWQRHQVDINGAVTSEISCASFPQKTVWLWSSTRGSVTIEVDILGDGNWNELEEVNVDANQLWHHHIPELMARVRLRFLPRSSAFVSAWLAMSK